MKHAELEELYRSRGRLAAAVIVGWCGLLLAALSALGEKLDKGFILAGIAIVASLIGLLLARRVVRIPCAACGTNLYGAVRAAKRRGARLTACPNCWQAFNE